MGKVYDITALLTVDKPKLKIGDSEYEIDDNKNTVIKVQTDIDKMNTDNTSSGYEVFDKALEALIGRDAINDIEEKHPGTITRLVNLQVVFYAVMAAITGEDPKDAQARFRRGQ